jgi:hypothetical protein
VRPRPSPVVSGFVGTMGLSDFRRGCRPAAGTRVATPRPRRISHVDPATFAACCSPYPGGSGQGPSRISLARVAFPTKREGRHPRLVFRGLLGIRMRYGPQLRLPTPGGRYPRLRGAGHPVRVSALGLLPGRPISSPGETLTHVYAGPLVAHRSGTSGFHQGSMITARRPPCARRGSPRRRRRRRPPPAQTDASPASARPHGRRPRAGSRAGRRGPCAGPGRG